MKFKHIIIDWDGCVVNSLPIWLDAYQQTFNQNNLSPSNEDIIQNCFDDYYGATSLGISEELLDDFLAKVYETVYDNRSNIALHENVGKTLEYLNDKKKKDVIITTSMDRDFIGERLTHFKVYEHVSFIIDTFDIEKAKPDPDLIYKALELVGGEKKDALIIGDSDKDILAGKAAGIKTCLFYPSANQFYYSEMEQRSLNPDYLIRDFKELKDIIK